MAASGKRKMKKGTLFINAGNRVQAGKRAGKTCTNGNDNDTATTAVIMKLNQRLSPQGRREQYHRK